MALDKYIEKRQFDKTPEPKGGKSNLDKLVFVVQKHAASHLHYDFRLEMRGVLKSWAVPKGPSMKAGEHRLAQEVEDHPFDYKDFEGHIPKGQYGGGTVIVWDQGTYEPAEKINGKKEQEHALISAFYKNSLRIKLKGQKLKGEFMLVRNRDRGENSWLLTKVDDRFALKSDISKKDKSVKSGQTIEQMAENEDAHIWQSNHSQNNANSDLVDDISSVAKKNGKRKPVPASVSPMLCTLTKEPIDSEEYLYEIKWDGYRIISIVNGSKIRMDSRSSLDYTKKYPPVAQALKKLGHKVVLDGEVVVFNQEGKPDFDALQKYNGHNTPINYCVFDILWLDGYDLTAMPLTERKALLEVLVKDNEVLKFSESFYDGPALYEQSVQLDLEGIVAKRKDSTYQFGARGTDWLKTPTRKRQEFVIGGWAESDKSRSFRSLLFGAYENGKLNWIGRSGGGYKDKEMPGILAALKKLEIKESPFENKVLDTKGAVIHWVKPQMVANFEFATWTKSGRIRKPATFLGFRKDKKAKDVVREVPLSEKAEEKIENNTVEVSTDSNWPKILDKEIRSAQDFDIEGETVTLNNVEQALWKNVTKADLITYYHSVWPYMMPYLKDRPLSLHIKDSGAEAPGFYIKDMEGHEPGYAEIFRDQRRHKKKGKRDIIDYIVCNNEPTLLYLVNLGCIDFNPWSSCTADAIHADYISVDLDPSDNDFKKAINVALAAKEVFDHYKLKSLVKTSGKTGIHLFLPCSGITFPQARSISEYLCNEIATKVPRIATTEVSVSRRGKKLFVDPSQNDYADTLACAYSVRPSHKPTVSTPLEWNEINEELDPSAFTIETILQRLESKGDLFKELFNKKWRTANTRMLKKVLTT
jgi:bifunctional non-homologous end joining protein LigD